MEAEIGAPDSSPGAERDRRDERDAGGDEGLRLAQRPQPGHERLADPRCREGGVERPVAGAAVVRVVGHPRGVVDPRVGVPRRHPAIAGGRREGVVVAQHHRDRGGRAPRLTAVAPGGVVAAVHHLGVARQVEHPAAPGARRRGRHRTGGQPRGHRAHGVDAGEGPGAGAAQQLDPHLVGGEPVGLGGLPGVDVDLREVVGLARLRAPQQVHVARRPPRQHVPARGAARGVAAAHPDLHPAVVRGDRRPGRDQLGEPEPRADPRRAPDALLVGAAAVAAGAAGLAEHQPAALDPDPGEAADAPLVAAVPLGVGDRARGPAPGRLGGARRGSCGLSGLGGRRRAGGHGDDAEQRAAQGRGEEGERTHRTRVVTHVTSVTGSARRRRESGMGEVPP